MGTLTYRLSISFPEPTCHLVSAKTKRHVGSGNEIDRLFGDDCVNT